MRALVRTVSLIVVIALFVVPAWAGGDVLAQGKKGGGGGGGGGTSPTKDATLSSLSVSAGTLSPAFASGTLAYTVGPSVLPSTVRVTAVTTQVDATFTVDGIAGTSGAASQDIALGIGVTRVTIRVTARDRRTLRSYTIDFDRTSVGLSGLSAAAGPLSPVFSSSTVAYLVGPVSAASTTVTATAEDPNATVRVNGVTVASGSASGAIALGVGITAVSVEVVARDGSSQTTTLSVDRTSVLLSSLTLSAGSLSPAFSSVITSYGIGPVLAATTTVTATALDANATVKVNGTVVASGATSGAISLGMGFTSISVEVLGRDGTTATTTVTVDRTSAGITSVTASAGPLTYSAPTSTYLAGPALLQSSTTITVNTEDSGASVTVNGSAVDVGVESSAVALAPGLTTITVVVTARDGVTTATRYIEIDRALEGDVQSQPGLGQWYTRVAMYGDTMVVGCLQENYFQRGAVRVYRLNRASGAWEIEADLYPTGRDQDNMQFGGALAIWGDTIAIGAQCYSTDWTRDGAVFIYRRGASGWAFEAKLDSTYTQGREMRFGHSVALYEDTLVVGAQQWDSPYFDAGGVFVWTRSGTSWTERAYLNDYLPGETAQKHGWYVAIHGDTIAFASNKTQRAYVYTGSGGTWTRQAALETGGNGVSLWGDTMVAGATIYERAGGTWTPAKSLVGEGVVTGGDQGFRSMYGDTVVMRGSSSVVVFLRTAMGWEKRHTIAAPSGATSDFGFDVAVWAENIGVVAPVGKTTYMFR